MHMLIRALVSTARGRVRPGAHGRGGSTSESNLILASVAAVILQMSVADAWAADEATIDLVRRAQQANLERFPAGRLKATYATGQEGQVTHHVLVEADVSWIKDRCRSTVKRWRSPRPIDPNRAKPNPPFEWIFNPTRTIVHEVQNQRVTISPLGEYAGAEEARLTPKRTWYGPLDAPVITWTELLNPKAVGGFKASLRVESNTQDAIVIVHDDEKSGDVIRMTFSRALDFNVVRHEITKADESYSSIGTYEWTREAAGGVRLVRAEVACKVVAGGTTVATSRMLTISDFDADFTPATSAFELSSIKLPDGVVIEDHVTGKRRRVGDREVDQVSGSLNSLIDEMRSRGFAKDR